METLNLIQGTPEWHAHRGQHDNASDAPAMMGESAYKSRSALLTERATGIAPEFDAGTQRRFDDGHLYESLALSLAEKIIGQDLFPVTGVMGNLSASFDGITMDESICWEHKTLNNTLRDIRISADLPAMYRIQMEQQLLISGAERCLFSATKWEGTECIEQIHVWYEPDLALRQRIVDGWAQFHKDLESWVPVVHAEKPKSETTRNLPALAVQIRGEVALSNLPQFKAAADTFIASIKVDLTSDQDFAEAEADVKFLGDAEKELELAKKIALGQTVDINELMITIDAIKESMRQKRLSLEKLVKDKKEQIKIDIVHGGETALAEHLKQINDEIAPIVIKVAANFGAAIKGKRTLASLHDAVDTEVARIKIEADQLAMTVRKNLSVVLVNKQYASLFADLSTLALQPNDAFSAIVENRIAAEKARVAEREAQVAAQAVEQAAQEAAKAIAAAAVPAPVAAAPAAQIVAPPPTPKYSAKPGPTLHEIASLLAFDKGVDVNTARAWIITAVNQVNQKEAA